MADSPYIASVTQSTFETEVIERSMNTLVLVDFWAGWCNPCKMLMPILAGLAEEYNGAFFLAKVDTDTERSLAEKYGIRSLPTVRFFKQGQVVDEFNGAIPAQEVRLYIERHKFQEQDFDFQKAKQAYEKGELDVAENLLNDILQKDTDNKNASILQARIALQKGEFEKVDNFFAQLPINLLDDPDIKEIQAQLSFAKEIANAPSKEELEQTLVSQENIDARYQLACRYAINKEYEKAMENFLLVMQTDRKYKDDGARKNILAIFDLLGGSGPLVNVYRVKMSRLLH